MSPVADSDVLRGVGPQDVDQAGDLAGDVGLRNQGRLLIKANAQRYPQKLVTQQGRPTDPVRTAELDYDEVRDAAVDLLGKDSVEKVETASVKGSGPPEESSVIILYLSPSGRTARCFVPYSDLKKSVKAAEKAVKEGRTSTGYEDKGDLQSEVDRLRAELQGRSEGKDAAPEPAPEPYPGYEDAGANEVIESISGLSLRELLALQDAEAEGKDRKTVNEAIEAALDAAEYGRAADPE